ncbi:MAG TPA: aspartate aminotransferase family protein [Microthrixaceae bacterium]|nr:aspartate aminotransferase family protein [Microthrixaceae bacterium]
MASPTTIEDHITIRAREIADRELRALIERTPASKAMYDRAVRSMPGGVASSFQLGDPYPLYLERGVGPEVWDVDGHQYFDFHNGFGSMAVGHANPIVAEAVEHAARNGMHFAVTVETTVALAEELCRRFNCDMVRFTNSGTESNMTAIRVARAATGRDVIAKIEGSYHGHLDQLMYSVLPGAESMGGRETPNVVPRSKGVPAAMADWIRVVRFNDAEALEALFEAEGDSIAALIMEPVMMNIGIVLPQPGYLERVRELCTRYGIVLIFDEVKCGCTIAAGGAAERFGVQADLSSWAKSIGGGAAIGAFGGKAELMEEINRGAAHQGTFNGNPLSVAASLATLTRVLTPDAYSHFDRLGARLAGGLDQAIAEHSIPAHTVDLGAKGCVSYRSEPLTNYRDFLETNTALYDASYPWMVNRGVFMTPGDEEQWTLSVQHGDEQIDRFVDAFGEFCAELSS